MNFFKLTSAAVLFAATAAHAQVTADAPAHPAAHQPDNLAVDNVVYQGWKMYQVYCARCHGEDAEGTSFGPALMRSVGPDGRIDHKTFWLTVTAGRPAQGMPSWGNLLTPEQKEDIWNYLRARAVGGLGGGRPHIKTGASRDSTVLPPAQGKDTLFVPPYINN